MKRTLLPRLNSMNLVNRSLLGYKSHSKRTVWPGRIFFSFLIVLVAWRLGLSKSHDFVFDRTHESSINTHPALSSYSSPEIQHVHSSQERPDGNQLLYLETPLVYYPHSRFPKLTTPMWCGEPGVEAVIILSIDDLHDAESFDQFLNPILKRLKQLTGRRSPLSIMANKTDLHNPILQRWLKSGVTIEAHTSSHPCPLLRRYDFKGALNEVASCLDQLFTIPGNIPVAFRMPCCDSQNSVSPRFYSEIFLRPTPMKHILRIDSSIFLLLTPQDPDIPPSCIADSEGRSIFKKYLPSRDYVNYIENYPYPYLIHNAVWEFPPIIPSDWVAALQSEQDFSQTLEDLKKALDAVVIKKGVFVLCLHPNDLMKTNQVVDFIDYAEACYGKKVKFLNFKEAYKRLLIYLLGGTPVHSLNRGDNGVRLLDLNNDEYLDVVVGNPEKKETRIWDPHSETWSKTSFPLAIVDKAGRQTGVKFVCVQKNGYISMLLKNEKKWAFHHFNGKSWGPPVAFSSILPKKANKIFSFRKGKDRGLRSVDFNGDGFSDLVFNNERHNETFLWNPEVQRWDLSQARLPQSSLITDKSGKDRGHRFVDINGDGLLDSICSNEEEYSVAFYRGELIGWSKPFLSGKQDQPSPDTIPPIVERGSLMGAWFRGRTLYIQNERTGSRSTQILKYTFLPFSVPRVLGLWNFEQERDDVGNAIALPGKGAGNDPQTIEEVPCARVYDPLTGEERPNSSAVRFDGKDDYLRLIWAKNDNSPPIDLTLSQTLEAFVRLESPPPRRDYVCLLLGRWVQHSKKGDQFAVFLHGDCSMEAHAQSEVGYFQWSHSSGRGGRLEQGKWHHIAALYWFDEESRTAHVRLYQDYHLVSENSFEAEGPLSPTSLPYQVGGEGDALTGPFRFIHATFDEVRITSGILRPEHFLRCKKKTKF